MAAGYVNLEPAEQDKVIRSQMNLLHKRGAIWGRILTMKLFGLPVPNLIGFGLFKDWRRLHLAEKIRSIAGTVRRIRARRLRRPLKLQSMEAVTRL
jgi:coenzyme F420 hydrogenase subunit beta